MGMGRILEEFVLRYGRKITQRRRVHRDFAEGKRGEGVPIWEELVHPGSFRKSGKQRRCGIRNLEECGSARKRRR